MRNRIARPAIATPPSNAYRESLPPPPPPHSMYGGRGLSSLACAVLSPVSGTAKLKMNVKIDGDTSMPQVSAESP